MSTMITSVDPAEEARDSGTPTGNYTSVVAKNAAGDQLGGDSSANKATLIDLENDRDQFINLGAGDDLFVFNATNASLDLNGIVDMGTGDKDTVFVNYDIRDFEFTIRNDGGIKMKFVGLDSVTFTDDGPVVDNHGDAVTVRNADVFTFRNVRKELVDTDNDGVGDKVVTHNYENITLTYNQLVALINANSEIPAM
jgi:hypothetical protein